jgi:hypothetical protein
MQRKHKSHRQLLDHKKLIDRAQKRKQVAATVAATTNKASVIPPVINKVVTKYSLENYITFPVYDQGDLGSCTANAFCTAFRMRSQIQNKYKDFVPSRLFFYYNERAVEGDIPDDAGADVVDGELYVQLHGICSEELWPYNAAKFAVQPPPTCFSQARQYRISRFQTLLQVGSHLVAAMKQQLLANEPLLIAVALFDSFMNPSVTATGLVVMPDQNKEMLQGGHEMCVVGFDDLTQRFTVMNSWGSGWGRNGRCFMPYSYFADPNLCYEVTFFSL